MLRDWPASNVNPKRFDATESTAGNVCFGAEFGLFAFPDGLLMGPDGLLGSPGGSLGGPDGLLGCSVMQTLLERVNDALHSSHWLAPEAHFLQFSIVHCSSR